MEWHRQSAPCPVSIEITAAGSKPVVTINNRFNEDGTPKEEHYTNPWRDLGGEDSASFNVGDQLGYRMALEWVITFNGKPSVGQWGRNKWSNSLEGPNFQVNKDGSVVLFNSGTEDDNQAMDDYILGNKVYMYNAPGIPIFSTSFIFEVWARSRDREISNWYYVNLGTGEFWEINKPRPFASHGAAPDVYLGSAR